MGKTKIKTIDDSAPVVKTKESEKKTAKSKPKDTLAASLLEQLNKEFGEVKPSYAAYSAEAAAKAGKALEGKQEKEQVDVKRKEVKAERAEKKPAQKAKVKPRGKKYQEAAKLVDPAQNYPLDEAVELVKKASYTKFDGSMELHINTALKGIRGLVSLPFASGKKLKVLVFGKDADKSGADMVGDDDKIEEISKGKISFDVLVATPEWMPKLAKVAKVLGPKGLMPNPKNGTISENLAKTIAELQGGKREYKTESNGQVIHLIVGKVSQPVEEISANVKTLYTTIGKSKIIKMVLSPTMGPGVKIDLASI